MKRYCYQCRNTFSSYSDYCPHDGTKLETFKAKKSFSESKVSSNNKLNSFLKKFNLKPVSKKFSKDDLGVPLPKDLQELGWCYTGPVASCSYVDTWPVECNLNQKSSIFGLFRRFRSGSLSNYNIYQKVQKINKKLQLSQVSAYGTTDFGGARTDYELVVLPKDGINPVSYTHLRAHETVLDLVCRLLLEKKTDHRTLTFLGNAAACLRCGRK